MMEYERDQPDRAFPPHLQTDTSTDDGSFSAQTTNDPVVSVSSEPTQETYTYMLYTPSSSDDVRDSSSTSSDEGIFFPTPSTTLQTTASAVEISSVSASTTSASTSSSIKAGAASETRLTESATYQPIASQQKQHSADLSSGQLAAAIVSPIIFVLLLTFLAFLLLRRRQRNSNSRNNAGEERTESRASFLPAGFLKEKWSSHGSGNSVSSTTSSHGGRSLTAPEVTNATNNAYFTGLDTSSHGSRSQDQARTSGGSADPPPPYQYTTLQRLSTAAVRNALPEVPHVQIDFSELETFPLPPAATTSTPPPQNPAYMTASPALPQRFPSSRSARSFSSDLYSDTASLHSAQAVRRSVGPNVVLGREMGEENEDRAGDPVSPL